MTQFLETFYDNEGATIGGVEFELIYPGSDSEGIVYFGGGHTGVTFDISDGTANDYSDDFLHHYSKGPTGFSGFQNLHEVSTASAVLDFTDITNNDTINDNTLRGAHHKLVEKKDGTLGRALFYARLNESAIAVPTTTVGTPWNQNDSYFVEDLYGSKLRFVRGFVGELQNGLSGTWSSVTLKGAITTLASNMASGATTVTLTDASRFYVGTAHANVQNILNIDGTSCKYTGKNGNTLTGVTLQNGNAINFTATAGDAVTANQQLRWTVEPNALTIGTFNGYVLLDNGSAEAFNYTGGAGMGSNLGYWSINNVSGGSGTAAAGNKVIIRRSGAVSTVSDNGPAYSVDTSDKGTRFNGQTAIVAHHFNQNTAAHNVEYGPLQELDCSQDHSISVWFKPTDTSFGGDSEVASGPLVTGVDKRGYRWGLYISGARGLTGNSTLWQQIRPSYIYHNGSGYTRKTIGITNGGLQIQRTAWTNLIVKATDGVVDFRAGSSGNLRFQRWHTGTGAVQTHDESSMISLTSGSNLPADATDYVNNVRSLATSSVSALPAQLPPDLCDGNPKTNSLFIGLSTIRRSDIIASWTDLTSNTSGSATLACGTDDGLNLSSDSTSNIIGNGGNPYTNNLWLHKTALANVAIFNYALPDSDCDEIFAGRGVW